MENENQTLSVLELVEKDRVHKRVYTDPDVFDQEMKNVFGKAWIYVGHESQVKNPGDFYTTTIGTEKVILVRHQDESLHVLYNRCPHRGAQLVVATTGHVSNFRCLYHGFTFATDGKLKAIPLESGYEGTSFSRCNHQTSVKPVASVESYRGFVFARLSEEGTDLQTWLGATKASFDNLCDRAPEGELEVVGPPILHVNNCNWKFILENITDALHVVSTHQSVSGPAKVLAKKGFDNEDLPAILDMLIPFGNSYNFFDKMEQTVDGLGHCFLEGQNIHSNYKEDPDYLEAMRAHYDDEKLSRTLSLQRQNTLLYPSVSFKTNLQSMRVFRPVSVNKTILETWTFRLKGAPDEMLKRTVLYNKTLFSPSSMAAHDDAEAFARAQIALSGDGHDWVSLHRYLNADRENADGTVTAPGTSDLPLRHQYQAWKRYMNNSGEPR